jgi:hypothetical protein
MFVQVDILQHRGEQIKSAEQKSSSLQQQLERLQQDLAQAAKDAAALKVRPWKQPQAHMLGSCRLLEGPGKRVWCLITEA